jgi:hypothetical protein
MAVAACRRDHQDDLSLLNRAQIFLTINRSIEPARQGDHGMSSKQAPIHSGFRPTTTARETLHGIELRGKVAIVTGGYSGIVLGTTRALAEAGATAIVPARTPDQASRALSSIPRVERRRLDLLDPGSGDAWASEFLSTGRPLHMLIKNAGIMATPPTRDVRGYESQFSANHLGHFQLMARLWPALRNGHARGSFPFLHAVTSAGELTLTILSFDIAPMTGGKLTANRKPRMCCLLWNSIGAEKRVECAPSQFIRELSKQISFAL